MLRRCRRHKERRRYSVQILDNFWDKCFGHKVTKNVCKQAPSLYGTDGASVTSIAFFNNPLSSHFLRVTFRQRTKFGQIFITPNSGRTFYFTLLLY